MNRNTGARRGLALTLGLGLLAAACAAPVTTPSASPSASLAAAASGSPTATPKPSRTPIPPLAEGMTRFKGTITDSTTGLPVEDVCVIIGPPVNCQDNFPHSDEKGLWLADLPVAGGLSWTFNFSKPGYALTIKKAVSSAPGEQTIDVLLPKQ
jgi:hypothetical protein